MRIAENSCLLLGRILMGVYFILPGLQKIANYQAMTEYMLSHQVPLTAVLLPLTILIQLLAGLALIVGFKGKLCAFLLAGLTLVISIYMHNFWAMPEGLERNHETQNFFKNMGIMAGLLIMASLGTGRFSLDNKLNKPAE